MKTHNPTSKMSSRTQGKWLAVWRDGAWRVVTDGNVPIAVVEKWTHNENADTYKPDSEQQANAEMLANGPEWRRHHDELLEKLSQLVAVCGAYDNGQMLPRAIVAALDQARAAINRVAP